MFTRSLKAYTTYTVGSEAMAVLPRTIADHRDQTSPNPSIAVHHLPHKKSLVIFVGSYSPKPGFPFTYLEAQLSGIHELILANCDSLLTSRECKLLNVRNHLHGPHSS
jgi:hypothetical protein